MQPDDERRFAFDAAWFRVALKELLRWKDQAISEWVSERRQRAEVEPGWFFHETPAYYLAALALLPHQRLRQKGIEAPDLGKLRERVQVAIEMNRGLECYSDEEYDWAAARERVNKVLAGIGESLPD